MAKLDQEVEVRRGLHIENDSTMRLAQQKLRDHEQRKDALETGIADLAGKIEQREKRLADDILNGGSANFSSLNTLRQRKTDLESELQIYAEVLAKSREAIGALRQKLIAEYAATNGRVVMKCVAEFRETAKTLLEQIPLLQMAIHLPYLSIFSGMNIDRSLQELTESIEYFKKVEEVAKSAASELSNN